MTQLELGIDVDGVVGDLAVAMSIMMEEETGTPIPKEEVTRWDYYIKVLGSATKMLGLMDEAWRRGIIPLEEDNIPATMTRLMDAGHTVSIITARTYESHPWVVEWLHKFKIPYHNLIFTHFNTHKLDFPIHTLVDDNPKLVKEALNWPHKVLILRRQPWNEDIVELPDNVIAIHALDEVIDIARSISEIGGRRALELAKRV